MICPDNSLANTQRDQNMAWKGEVKKVKIQYICVTIPEDECIYHVSQKYMVPLINTHTHTHALPETRVLSGETRESKMIV